MNNRKKQKKKPVVTDKIAEVMALLGTRGGKSKSDAKKRAARENGKLGGRPKKTKEDNK